MSCRTILSGIVSLLALGSMGCAQRIETPLIEGWRHVAGDPIDAQSADFSDAQWKVVTVPHVWELAIDDVAGPAGPQDAKSRRGPGWYRHDIEVTGQEPGQRTFVKFEAASLVADVYLNGKKLGQHRGGFTAFTFELTDDLKPGKNVLAVRVDNTHVDDIAPLSGDFTIFGGLYRPVHLITTGPACISPLLKSSSGVQIRQTTVNHDNATVDVDTAVSNMAPDKKPLTVRCTLLDATGKVTLEKSTPVQSDSTHATLNIANPHLWDGVADPYLYTLRVELCAPDGKAVDAVSQNIGLRFYHFDNEKGFTLNGHPYRLHGVCRHQDRGGSGWAISYAQQDEDMAIIRDLGANAVRLAHYPHSDYFLHLCDKNGILAWSEIPLVNSLGKNDAFTENAQQQLEEMITQLGNHCSVMAWGLWNELQGGAPAAPVIGKLHGIAHAADPTRPTTAASFAGSEKFCPDATKLTDLLAINTYPGWYRGTPEDMNPWLDKFRAFAPDQPLGVSEYGAGASIHQHQQGMTKGPAARGPWHPEEWQAIAHESQWKAIESRPYLWGSFIWNLFDFASAGRNEGDAPGINDKGLVTRDRKVKKDAFYFYKATWSTAPVVYITSRRDNPRVQERTPLKVYSNAANLKLTLNGKELPADSHEGVIYRWNEIKLVEGDNVVEVRASRDGKPCSDKVVWRLDPHAAIPKPPEGKPSGNTEP